MHFLHTHQVSGAPEARYPFPPHPFPKFPPLTVTPLPTLSQPTPLPPHHPSSFFSPLRFLATLSWVSHRSSIRLPQVAATLVVEAPWPFTFVPLLSCCPPTPPPAALSVTFLLPLILSSLGKAACCTRLRRRSCSAHRPPLCPFSPLPSLLPRATSPFPDTFVPLKPLAAFAVLLPPRRRCRAAAAVPLPLPLRQHYRCC